MGRVDCCRLDDIPAVADLHNKVFFDRRGPGSTGLVAYYRRVFFENPWVDNTLPPLVYRSGDRVSGFLGCVPRPMEIQGHTIRVATLHRLLVDPDADSPMAAFELVHELLSGPQDITFADGVNDKGRKILEWSGASLSPIFSLKWLRPLRPFSFLLNTVGKRHGLGRAAAIVRPTAGFSDHFLSRLGWNPFRLTTAGARETSIETRTLLEAIKNFSHGYSLRPVYDLRSLEWLVGFLRENTKRGELRCIGVWGDDNQLIGASVYYLDARRIAEVLLLASREDQRSVVLHHLLHGVWNSGGVGLMGRIDPRFLQAFSEHDCLMRPGDWALVHARNAELLAVINRGDAFISALEGELWMGSPMDQL